MLPAAVAWLSCGDVAICFVFPALRMTSYIVYWAMCRHVYTVVANAPAAWLRR